MCETLLLLGLALAGGHSSDDGAVLDNNRAFTRTTRVERGPRILQTIPYINRLVRTVGYTRTQPTLGAAIVGAAATHEDLQGPAETAAFPAEEQSLPANVCPALKPNETPACQPPDTAEILRALPSAVRLPYVLETYRDDLDIKTEKLVDKLNAPRCFPLIGPAQLHSVHWKCVVSFTETMETSHPFKVAVKRRRQEVVFIDKDRLYLVAKDCQPGQPLGGICQGDAHGKFGELKGVGNDVQLPFGIGWSRRAVRQIKPAETVHIMDVRFVSKEGCDAGAVRRQIFGEHLVRPDGTVSLGSYGTVYVAGMSAGCAKIAIEHHLRAHLDRPEVALEVFAPDELQARKPATSSHRVRACWNSQVDTCSDLSNPGTRLNVLKGTLYLFESESNATVNVDGRIHVTATNKAGQKVAEWNFDPETLAKLARRDMIGVGYTLVLPLDEGCLGEIRLNVAYHSQNGGACHDESSRMTLRRPLVVPAAVAEVTGGRVVQAMSVARAAEPGRLADAVRANHDIRDAAQVEFSVTVAEVNLARLNELRLALSEDGKARVNIVDNTTHGTLRQLLVNSGAKILAEPRIITVDGRPAHFLHGDDAKDKVLVNLLPIVQRDAVHLEFHGEITTGQIKHGTGIRRKVPSGNTLVMAFPEARRDKCVVILATPTTVQSVVEPMRKQMTFGEVIALSKQRIADDIIVRQMELTESIFRLSVEDIIHLHREGVSDAVIRAMQERATPRSNDVTPTRSKL